MNDFEIDITNLIHLRTNLITIIIVLTGGLVGLALSKMNLLILLFLIVPGIYFDFLFIVNVININNLINKKMRRINNERT